MNKPFKEFNPSKHVIITSVFIWAGVSFQRKGRLFVPKPKQEYIPPIFGIPPEMMNHGKFENYANMSCTSAMNRIFGLQISGYQKMVLGFISERTKPVSRWEYPLDKVRARVTGRRDSEDLSDEMVG